MELLSRRKSRPLAGMAGRETRLEVLRKKGRNEGSNGDGQP